MCCCYCWQLVQDTPLLHPQNHAYFDDSAPERERGCLLLLMHYKCTGKDDDDSSSTQRHTHTKLSPLSPSQSSSAPPPAAVRSVRRRDARPPLLTHTSNIIGSKFHQHLKYLIFHVWINTRDKQCCIGSECPLFEWEAADREEHTQTTLLTQRQLLTTTTSDHVGERERKRHRGQTQLTRTRTRSSVLHVSVRVSAISTSISPPAFSVLRLFF